MASGLTFPGVSTRGDDGRSGSREGLRRVGALVSVAVRSRWLVEAPPVLPVTKGRGTLQDSEHEKN